MQPDIQTTITNVLAPLPVKERVWALACSIVADNPGGAAIKALVSMAALMAGHLSAGQRAEIAWRMHREAAANWVHIPSEEAKMRRSSGRHMTTTSRGCGAGYDVNCCGA